MTLFAGQPRRTSQVLCVIRGENSISEITPSLCGARLDPGIEKCWRYQTHTSSMSKESAFSVRSWASLGGTRVGGTFSGVEVRFFFSSSSFPIAWVPFSVPWLVDWRSVDCVCCAPLAAVLVLSCSGLLGGEMLASNKQDRQWCKVSTQVLYLDLRYLYFIWVFLFYVT